MKWDYITAAIGVEYFVFLSLLTECLGRFASSSYQWLCCSLAAFNQLCVCQWGCYTHTQL